MQFYADPVVPLSAARDMVRVGGRVVVAHANGGDFVADERRGSPQIVLADMPSQEALELLGGELGLELVGAHTVDEEGRRDFYLATFVRVC